MKSPNIFSRVTSDVREAFSGKTPRWGEDGRALPKAHKFVHFCALLWRNFVRNRCPVRASALAYTTLLALVPLLAVGLSVSKLFLTPERAGSIVDDSIGYVVNQFAPRLGLIPSEASGTDAQEET